MSYRSVHAVRPSVLEGSVVKNAFVLKSALALAMVSPMLASAESNLVINGSPATARLDFRVVIPQVLLLQVGSTGANNVDRIEFNLPTTTTLGDSTSPVARTNGGAVPVRVLGNNGAITLAVSNTGDLSNGAGDTIPWTSIGVSSAQVSGGGVPHPAPSFSGSTVLPTTAGKITDSQAQWTFSYLNNIVPAAGAYGGVNSNNGRVTYTASMP